MRAETPSRLTIVCSAVLFCTARATSAQTLPPTPTTVGASTAPLAGTASAVDDPGERPHHAQVNCDNGQLEIRAENSSLNSILREVSRCTGMHITGGVPEQRVFGNYGPAAPATVIATLIDGTGSNMLLKETSADQPAELILTPRLGGPTPPSPSTYTDADAGNGNPNQTSYPGQQPSNAPPNRYQSRPYPRPDGHLGQAGPQQLNQTPVPQPEPGSAVTSPPSLPQPMNNVNGSPSNTSPTASTYPTTNSVPLDSVATPSTTPSTNGIVDAPNPPPTAPDTAGGTGATPNRTPGNTDFNPNTNSQTATPDATNTTVPGNNPQNPNQAPATLTPEQIFQQLQQRQQQSQQQQPQQQPANPQ